jgi:hypothetical protein
LIILEKQPVNCCDKYSPGGSLRCVVEKVLDDSMHVCCNDLMMFNDVLKD